MKGVVDAKKSNQFGNKVNELFHLLDTVEDWDKYVTRKTASVVRTLQKTQSMNETMAEFNMKYVTVRSHVLRAIERITKRDTVFKREGKSQQSQELFELMDTVEDWEVYVTDNEADLAKQFRDIKNFYELGRMLNLAPSNIAGTLYGTTQKIGVIAKIKSKIPQINRRDVDGRRE